MNGLVNLDEDSENGNLQSTGKKGFTLQLLKIVHE